MFTSGTRASLLARDARDFTIGASEMEQPDFRTVATDDGERITYTCGCPCVPAAGPTADGGPGFEHCCCGKVHFVGAGASAALTDYLAERKKTKKREPTYTRGTATVALGAADVEVAWAFPAS